MDIIKDILQPYGVQIVIVCIATYIVLKILEWRKVNIHAWFKVAIPFAISAIVIAIDLWINKGFNSIQNYIGKIFNLGSYAATAYGFIIKYITLWVEDMANKFNNTDKKDDPPTSGNITPTPPPNIPIPKSPLDIALGK